MRYIGLLLPWLLAGTACSTGSGDIANIGRATGSLSSWKGGNCLCNLQIGLIDFSCVDRRDTALDHELLQFYLPQNVDRREMFYFHWQVRTDPESVSSDQFDPGPVAGPVEFSWGPSDGEHFDLYIHELQFHETTGCSWDGNNCRTKEAGSLHNAVVRCEDRR